MPVKGRRCVLEGKAVHSPERFYGELSAQLSFPGHFGRNLDALWDVLTADIEGPVEVVWKDPESSRKAMGPDFERIVEVLRKVAGKRKDFRLRLVSGSKRP